MSAVSPPEARQKLRRSGLLLVIAGVVLSIVLGSLLAAVDLWGGVRSLGVRPRSLGVAFALAASLLGWGAVRWLRSWPAEERVKRGLQAALGLAALAAVLGGGLFAYYAARLRTSDAICARAQCALTRAERDALLDEGLGPLFPVIDPGGICLDLERERRDLRAKRTCPAVVLDGQPCSCGGQSWSAAHPDRCPSGRTSCQSRAAGRGPTLGCAREYVARQLARCSPDRAGQ